MKPHLDALPLNLLLTTALTLILSANCIADEKDILTQSQQNSVRISQLSTKDLNVIPDTTVSSTRLTSPSSMLLAPAVKFKNTAGTPGYYREAYDHHCHAAKSGDPNSLFALGWQYVHGRGIPKDGNVAAYLLAKAAEQGHEHAQELLAEINADSSAPPPVLPACLLPDPPPAPVINATASGTTQDDLAGTISFYPKDGPIFSLVSTLAPRYQIDADLAMAFIAVESGFNTYATSPKNAQGLMQLIPETAKRFHVRNAYNAEDNIKGGLAYLQWLLAFFQGNVRLVAAAYNAGERSVEKHKGVPPYPETQNYVQKITMLYKKPSHPFRDDLVKASPFLNLP